VATIQALPVNVLRLTREDTMRVALYAGMLAFAMLSACSAPTQVRPVAPAEPVARPTPPAAAAKPCTSCGRVEKIEVITSAAAPKDRAVLGGVVGGVLTRPATIPGGTNGSGTKSYRLTIRLDGGRQLLVTQKAISPNLKVGSRVRIEGSRVVLLR
jgi:hypothetical protein